MKSVVMASLYVAACVVLGAGDDAKKDEGKAMFPDSVLAAQWFDNNPAQAVTLIETFCNQKQIDDMTAIMFPEPTDKQKAVELRKAVCALKATQMKSLEADIAKLEAQADGLDPVAVVMPEGVDNVPVENAGGSS